VEPISIKFSRKELALAKQIATARYQWCKATNTPDAVKKNNPNNEVDILGLKGEIAVGKLLQIDDPMLAQGLDGGYDFWIDDISIDVKTSFYETGKLLFRRLDKFKSDIAILVTSVQNSEDVVIRGWITKSEFLERSSKNDLGYGVCYTLDQSKLRPISDLIWNLTKRRLNK